MGSLSSKLTTGYMGRLYDLVTNPWLAEGNDFPEKKEKLRQRDIFIILIPTMFFFITIILIPIGLLVFFGLRTYYLKRLSKNIDTREREAQFEKNFIKKRKREKEIAFEYVYGVLNSLDKDIKLNQIKSSAKRYEIFIVKKIDDSKISVELNKKDNSEPLSLRKGSKVFYEEGIAISLWKEADLIQALADNTKDKENDFINLCFERVEDKKLIFSVNGIN